MLCVALQPLGLQGRPRAGYCTINTEINRMGGRLPGATTNSGSHKSDHVQDIALQILGTSGWRKRPVPVWSAQLQAYNHKANHI